MTERPAENEASPLRRLVQTYWIPFTVVVLGVVSISMLIGTNWIREQLMVQDIALVHAVGEIQTREATSHLWLEEYVTGDEIHLDEVWENQERSAYLIHVILEGGEVQERYSLKPVEDPELRARALAIRDQIEEFRSIAKRRQRGYERGEPVGVGSAIDKEYDQVFNGLLDNLRAFSAAVDESLERAHAQSSLLFRTIIVAWVLIVALAVTSLWSRERRRLLAEAALRESESQLRQSQKMEAVGRLAGGLAHDINNYLAAIISQTELLKLRAKGGDDTRERLDAVVSTASKAAGLIRRLLAFSRKEPVRPEPVDLNTIIGDLKPMLDQLIGEDVQLETALARGLWKVKVDPGQVEQVIVNLVVNAREAMPTGGKVMIETRNLQVSRRDQTDDAELVTLSVADNGPGIAEDVRDKIFDPFVTTKDTTTSSGLGLATVYAIVQQARGSIDVDSGADGTRFEIHLPRTLESPAASTKPEPHTVLGGSQRILLVEDNDPLRASTSETLEALGYSVVTAKDGESALRRFEDTIELLVTDVVMPGMNGREVADKLLERAPGLPVIFISGYPDDVVLRHGIQENVVDFVPKPFSIETLTATIRDVLDRAKRGVAAPPPLPAGTLLLVEDESILRVSLSRLLQANGFAVFEAPDGLAGEILFREHVDEIDCVILDLGLPGKSGRDLFEELRTIRPDIPIIVASGSDDGVERFSRDSITGVLSKPFDLQELERMLRSATAKGTFPEVPGS